MGLGRDLDADRCVLGARQLDWHCVLRDRRSMSTLVVEFRVFVAQGGRGKMQEAAWS